MLCYLYHNLFFFLAVGWCRRHTRMIPTRRWILVLSCVVSLLPLFKFSWNICILGFWFNSYYFLCLRGLLCYVFYYRPLVLAHYCLYNSNLLECRTIILLQFCFLSIQCRWLCSGRLPWWWSPFHFLHFGVAHSDVVCSSFVFVCGLSCFKSILFGQSGPCSCFVSLKLIIVVSCSFLMVLCFFFNSNKILIHVWVCLLSYFRGLSVFPGVQLPRQLPTSPLHCATYVFNLIKW